MIKTTTLETSKLLKENGFRQDNSFYWIDWGKVNNWTFRYKAYIDVHWNEIIARGHTIISSPTTYELLEDIHNDYIRKYLDVMKMTHWDEFCDLFRDPNELAKCWLWLKKEGLI